MASAPLYEAASDASQHSRKPFHLPFCFVSHSHIAIMNEQTARRLHQDALVIDSHNDSIVALSRI